MISSFSVYPNARRKAVAIIREGRGTQFDPDIVDAFLQIREEFRTIALRFADFDDERSALALPNPTEFQ